MHLDFHKEEFLLDRSSAPEKYENKRSHESFAAVTAPMYTFIVFNSMATAQIKTQTAIAGKRVSPTEIIYTDNGKELFVY